MIMIGEKLNSSIPSVLTAMEARDDAAIIALAKAQEEAGAQFLDVNTAILGESEAEMMAHIVPLLLENTDCGIMIDSPNPNVILSVLDDVADREIIINSVTLTERMEELAPVAASLNCGIVGLPIDDDGIPATAEARIAAAKTLIAKLKEYGIAESNMYIDILAEALALDSSIALVSLETARALRAAHPDVHLTCGLSNVSFGLPNRVEINAAFATALILSGVDSAIIDPTSKRMQSAVAAAELIAGKDEYCMNYIEKHT